MKCKTKYLVKSAVIYTAITACMLLGAKLVLAQAPTRTIIVSPPTVSDRFDPGSQKEGTMKITNTSEYPITFKAVIRDFIVEDTVGTPIIYTDLTNSKAKYAASSWVGVYPSEFTVEAGQTQLINYYIQVPADARPGGRYAAVVYEPQERINVQGTGTGVETHIGTLFVFRVNGDIIENATVTRFEAEKKFWEYGPVTINTQILNQGDSHIRPVGSIAIKNLLGQVVATQSLPEHNIFPEAARDFLSNVGEKVMFGPHTAELRATYGDNNNKTLFATASFFVFPWKIGIIVALVVIVIILLIIYIRRKRGRGPVVHHKPAETHQTSSTPPPATLP